MSYSHKIVRSHPWSGVPSSLQNINRTSFLYYRLTQWLRKNPPNKKTFTLEQLSSKFNTYTGYVRHVVNEYRLDAKIFLKYIPKPTSLKSPEKEYNWAIDQLHKQGFFLVNPLQYHSKWWGEPSFHQFADYTYRYYKEAVHRAIYRLEDALYLSLPIDGIDIRKELTHQLHRKAIVESCSLCKHEYRCIPPKKFKCPWGKTWEEGEEKEIMTDEELKQIILEYRKKRWIARGY